MGPRKQVLEAAVASFRSLSIQAVGTERDKCKEADASRVVETVVNEFGRLDILINGDAGNFLVAHEDLSPNGFKTVMDIDALGTFTMSRAAVNYLKQGGQGKGPIEGGTIINISATLHYTATWYQLHVSAAKVAIDNLTSLASEWGTDYKIQLLQAQ